MRASGVLLLACLSAAPAARAGALHGLAQQALSGRPGEWVTYRLGGGEGSGRGGYWRLAAVGAERDRLGREALWLEVEAGPHAELRAPLLQLRMLVARDVAARDAVTRLFVAIGAERPREVSDAALAALTAREPAVKERPSMPPAAGRTVRGARQPLMTSAGTVRAWPLDLLAGDVLLERLWVSEDVPLLRLARVEMPLVDHVMEVHAFGTDAVSRMALPVEGLERLEVRDVEALASLLAPGAATFPGGGTP